MIDPRRRNNANARVVGDSRTVGIIDLILKKSSPYPSHQFFIENDVDSFLALPIVLIVICK